MVHEKELNLTLKRRNSLKLVCILMEREAWGLTSSLSDLAIELYPQHTEVSKKYCFRCSNCNNTILRDNQKVIRKQRCKLRKRNRKICYAMRSSWGTPEEITVKEFKNKKVKNIYESNLFSRELRELTKGYLIIRKGDLYSVNYQKLMDDLFESLSEKTLGSWAKKVNLLVKWHYANLIKNKELCARVFCYPILVKNTLDKSIPKMYGDYINFVINMLSQYPLKLFQRIVLKNFRLNKAELNELLMLQKYCFVEETKRKETNFVIGWNTWGTKDNDPAVPIKFPLK